MDRHLAAVLIADVVGYSRLSQTDEEGTRARFQTDLKEVFEPKIAEHHGRLVKTMGDGILVEFHSVVDALRCAVQIQQLKAERNAAAPPAQRLHFRIGVNLGDIIVEGEDIHGDGVNIADRLQVLAEPGGIAISGTAYDHVKAKVPVGYASLGEQKVKNIAEPIRVYRVVLDPAAAGRTIGARKNLHPWRVPVVAAAVVVFLLAGAGAWWQPWRTAREPSDVRAVVAADTRPSLVVLPFENLSDDKQQGYLADGITEDLTTELARLPGLFIISRNAAFAYKDKTTQPAQVAAELGIRYILEGSVRRAGDGMRINAQLIDATTSGHMWAERFDGAWSDVFELQDKIVGEIATALKLRLVSGQQATQIAGGTSNTAAYETFLRGLEREYRDTPQDVAEAVALYHQALALDPNFGRVWAQLAKVYWNIHSPQHRRALGVPWNEVMGKVQGYLQEAQKRPSPTYYQILGDLLIRQQKSDEAIIALEKAIALDSSDPENYLGMSAALTFNGRPIEGRGYIDAAIRVDPGWTPWRYYLAGLAYFSMDRFAEAVESLEKIDPRSGGYWTSFFGLIVKLSGFGHLGRTDDVANIKKQLTSLIRERNEGEFSGLLVKTYFVFKHYADTRRLLDGLGKTGVPELPYGYDPTSKDMLTGEAARSLVFGHTIDYRNIGSEWGMRASTKFTRDGAASLSRPDGTVTGFFLKPIDPADKDSTNCFWWDKFVVECVAVFRNPKGTASEENEFLWINQGNPWSFSIVK